MGGHLTFGPDMGRYIVYLNDRLNSGPVATHEHHIQDVMLNQSINKIFLNSLNPNVSVFIVPCNKW